MMTSDSRPRRMFCLALVPDVVQTRSEEPAPGLVTLPQLLLQRGTSLPWVNPPGLERFSWSTQIEGINYLVIDVSQPLQGLLEQENVFAVFSFRHSLNLK